MGEEKGVVRFAEGVPSSKPRGNFWSKRLLAYFAVPRHRKEKEEKRGAQNRKMWSKWALKGKQHLAVRDSWVSNKGKNE